MERVSDSKRAYLSGQVPCSDRHAWASESEWKENEHVIVLLLLLAGLHVLRGTSVNIPPNLMSIRAVSNVLPASTVFSDRLLPRRSRLRVPILHAQYAFNVFTLELNTYVNTRIHFGPPHLNTCE